MCGSQMSSTQLSCSSVQAQGCITIIRCPMTRAKKARTWASQETFKCGRLSSRPALVPVALHLPGRKIFFILVTDNLVDSKQSKKDVWASLIPHQAGSYDQKWCPVSRGKYHRGHVYFSLSVRCLR